MRSASEFPIVLRLVRCRSPHRICNYSCYRRPRVHTQIRSVYVIVKFYHAPLAGECNLLLNALVRMLDSTFPSWHRILVLETLQSFCSDPALLYFFYARFVVLRQSLLC